MLYLASPYHHTDQAVMEQRYEVVKEIAACILRAGSCVYSPIVHMHPIALQYNLPQDWTFWQKLDYGMLRHAEEILVLMLPGWEQSKGISAEIKITEELSIPVVYIAPEDFRWQS